MELQIVHDTRVPSSFNMRKFITKNQINSLINGIQNGFDPNDNSNHFGSTLLHKAVYKKKHKIVKFLLSLSSIDANIEDNEGNTPLFLSCSRGFFNIVKLFTNKLTHRQMDAPNNEGITPLLISYRNGHMHITKFLLKKGCNFNYIGFDGFRLPRHFVDQTLEFIRRRDQIRVTPQRLEIEQIRTEEIVRERIINSEADRIIRFRHSEERRERIINSELRQQPPLIQIKKEIPNHVMNDHIEMLIELKKTCPVCYEHYESEKYVPVMTKCFHSLCVQCFSKVDECPICRTHFK